MKRTDQALRQADVNLLWQNHHFTILGSKAKPYLLRVLIGVQKVSKVSALGTNRRRCSHWSRPARQVITLGFGDSLLSINPERLTLRPSRL